MWITIIKYNPFGMDLSNCINIGVALIRENDPPISILSDHEEFEPRVKMSTRACVNRMIRDQVASSSDLIRFISKEANQIRYSDPMLVEGDGLTVLDHNFRKYVGGPSYAFPDPNRVEAKPISLWEELKEGERKRISHALALSAGNQSKAAKMLGISRYIIMDRMDEFGIPRPRKNRSGI